MSAFMIIQAKITDREKFLVYAKANPAIVAQYGGRYRVLGAELSVLEGQWGETKVVISEWPDRQSAINYWHSEEYAEVKKLREGTGEFTVLLTDEFQAD